MSSGPRDPEARAPRPDRRDWPKAKLVVPENALREAGMGRSPFGSAPRRRESLVEEESTQKLVD